MVLGYLKRSGRKAVWTVEPYVLTVRDFDGFVLYAVSDEVIVVGFVVRVMSL